MTGITFTLMSPSRNTAPVLVQQLQHMLQPYQKNWLMDTFKFDSHIHIHISAQGTIWNFSQKNQIIESASQALLRYLIQVEEKNIVAEIVKMDFGYKDESEQAKVLTYCRQLLEQDRTTSSGTLAKTRTNKRDQKTLEEIRSFLMQHQRLNITGFLQFRAGDYRNELVEVVESAVNNYLMDKQYQEFISLLQYFVYIQDAKIPSAHLMHQGGHQFILLNDQFKPIETTQLDAWFTIEMLDKEVNFEDMIVSTLITVAPQRIYIHTREPEAQIIKTIMQIFEGRFSICDYCRQCMPLLGDRQKKDQLFP